MNETVYTTAQVARILGVHKNTVFYWLKTGKVKEPKRDSLFNGRIWTEDDLAKIKEIRENSNSIALKEMRAVQERERCRKTVDQRV